MKIENAYLCVDCQSVTESDAHGGCDVCGSSSLLNLAKILNRNPQKELLNFSLHVPARPADEEAAILYMNREGCDRHHAA